jgi:hypothetical protein
MPSNGVLLVISMTLLAVWNAFYFGLFYEDSNVTVGIDGVGYRTVTTKNHVVLSLWFTLTIGAAF